MLGLILSTLIPIGIKDVLHETGNRELDLSVSANQSQQVRFSWAPLAVASVIVGILIAGQLATVSWDASAFLQVGEESVVRPFVEDKLGAVPMTPGQGHDGKYFFVQVHDPLLLDESTQELLERPAYRGQRVLYPLLVTPLRLLGPRAVVWGMLLVNFLALVVGTGVTSKLSVGLGGNPWLGLAFGLNVGLWFELLFDGAGAVAWLFGMAALLAIFHGRFGIAIGLLIAAVLAREAMLLVAIGGFVFEWKWRHIRRWSLLIAPLAATLAWGAWVRLRTLSFGETERELGAPFVGMFRTAQDWVWSDFPIQALLIGVIAAILVAVMFQAVRRPSLIAYGVMGFALLAPFLTEHVWGQFFDISRAVAPALTGFVVAIFLPGQDLDSAMGPIESSG